MRTLRQRNFALLWFGGLISLTGDWMLNIALPVYVYTVTGSTLATSVMFIAAFLPQPLLGSVAGVFADRWDRKRTLIVVDLLLMLGLVPLLLVRGATSLWIVYPVLLIESSLAQFFRPAESALLPTLVTEDSLVSANALSGLGGNLSRLIGPALGGIVVGLLGLRGVILSDAASFLISAALILPVVSRPGLRAPAVTPDRQRGRDEAPAPAPTSVRREWLEGLQLVRRDRVLSTIFLMAVAIGVGEGIFAVLLVVFVSRVLHGGALQLGWLMSAQAVGGLLGGALVASVGRRFRPARLLGWGALAFGIIDLLIVDTPALLAHAGPLAAVLPVVFGLAPAMSLVMLLFVVVGVPGAGMDTALTSLVQTTVPDRYMGRVFGAVLAVFALLTLAGMGLAGALGDRLGAVPLLNVQGSMYVLAGTLALLRLRGKWAPPAHDTPVAANAPVAAADEAERVPCAPSRVAHVLAPER